MCVCVCVWISFPPRLLAKCGAELSADFVLPSHVPFSHGLTSPQMLSWKTVQSRTESGTQTAASEMAARAAHPPAGTAAPGPAGDLHPERALTKHKRAEVLTARCFFTAPNRLKKKQNITMRLSGFVIRNILHGAHSVPSSCAMLPRGGGGGSQWQNSQATHGKKHKPAVLPSLMPWQGLYEASKQTLHRSASSYHPAGQE